MSGGQQGHLQVENQEKQWEGGAALLHLVPGRAGYAGLGTEHLIEEPGELLVGTRKWVSAFGPEKAGTYPAAKLTSRVCDLSACPRMGTPEREGALESQMLSPVGGGVHMGRVGACPGSRWGQELGDRNLGVTCRREQVGRERGQLG